MQAPQEPPRPHRLDPPAIYIIAWDEQSTLCMVMETRIDRPGAQAQGGTHVARRCDTSMINGTKLLNASGMTRGRRDGILKVEKDRQVIKQGSIHLKGIWIPFERAIQIARDENIYEELLPLFQPDVCRVLFHPNNIFRTRQVLETAVGRNPAFSVWFDKQRQYLEMHPPQDRARNQLQARPQYARHLNVQAQVLHAQQMQAQGQAHAQAQAQAQRHAQHAHAQHYAQHAQHVQHAQAQAQAQHEHEVRMHAHAARSQARAEREREVEDEAATHNAHPTHNPDTQPELKTPYAHAHVQHAAVPKTEEDDSTTPHASTLDLGHFDMDTQLGDIGSNMGLCDLGDPLEHVLASFSGHQIPTNSSETTVSSVAATTPAASSASIKHEITFFEAAPPHSPVPLDIEGSTSSGELPETEHFEYAPRAKELTGGWNPQFYAMDYNSDVGLPVMYGSVAHQYPGEHDDEHLFYFAN